MADLHSQSENELKEAQAEMARLIAQKETIEQQIKDIRNFLQSQDGKGFSGGLLDKEGFPLNNIDIIKIRTYRNQHACLQNDYTDTMKKIEQALYAVHEATKKCQDEGTTLIPFDNKLIEDEKKNQSEKLSHSGQLEHSLLPLKEQSEKFDQPLNKLKRMIDQIDEILSSEIVTDERIDQRTNVGSDLISDSGGSQRSEDDQNGINRETNQQSNSSNVGNINNNRETNISFEDYNIDRLVPFGVFTNIAEGSPAETAGIIETDAVLVFGDIFIPPSDTDGEENEEEDDDGFEASKRCKALVKRVGEFVKNSEGSDVRVIVIRRVSESENSLVQSGVQKIEIVLKPQRWRGNGLLGCRLDPLRQYVLIKCNQIVGTKQFIRNNSRIIC
ncbi:MAG: hypothetical protein EZS28_035874 [Streblomastix strix]|uniref:Nas2 N-terminal domain-containing protein n=1 Tax=Streblomastix strix TaxID=222440 RepID=A0A5J4UER8_9EUKA|nr:MAG: hypothetical protein EZS28_035874 [Streblomastix strix]